jgi:hypothetical protein
LFNARLQPRRRIIAPAAVGCKPMLASVKFAIKFLGEEHLRRRREDRISLRKNREVLRCVGVTTGCEEATRWFIDAMYTKLRL